MRTDAQTHRRTGAQWTLSVVAALAAAVSLAITAGPAVAQRLPERFDLPAEKNVTPAQGAAALRPVANPALLLPVRSMWADTQTSGGRSRGLLSQVVVGSVGSIAGMLGGMYLGLGVCKVTTPCGGDHAGEEYAFVGIPVGSIVGTAAGTALGASAVGVAPGNFGGRIAGAAVGLLAGAGVVRLLGHIPDQNLTLLVFPVTQALVTALLAPRPPEGGPR